MKHKDNTVSEGEEPILASIVSEELDVLRWLHVPSLLEVPRARLCLAWHKESKAKLEQQPAAICPFTKLKDS